MINRRKFLKSTSALIGAGVLLMCSILPFVHSCSNKSSTCKNKLRDRLWMWGHEMETINTTDNLPKGRNIGIVEAINWMNIPNVCVINHGDVIQLPFDDEYIKQYKDVEKVAWSIMSGPEWSPQPPWDTLRQYSHDQLIKEGIKLLDKMPNLTEFYLDDFFAGNEVDESTGLAISNMSLERLKSLKAEIQTLKRQPQLTLVLYTSQLNPGIKEYINYFDRVSLWTWEADDLSSLEDNFRKYRELVPDKPTLLGIYMWDFGSLKTISLEQMKMQLDFAYKMLMTGAVEELIFHCTPLCGMDLEAVHYSRQWIAEHGSDIIEKDI